MQECILLCFNPFLILSSYSHDSVSLKIPKDFTPLLERSGGFLSQEEVQAFTMTCKPFLCPSLWFSGFLSKLRSS